MVHNHDYARDKGGGASCATGNKNKNGQNLTLFNVENQQYLPHFYSDKGLKDIFVKLLEII